MRFGLRRALAAFTCRGATPFVVRRWLCSCFRVGGYSSDNSNGEKQNRRSATCQSGARSPQSKTFCRGPGVCGGGAVAEFVYFLLLFGFGFFNIF